MTRIDVIAVTMCVLAAACASGGQDSGPTTALAVTATEPTLPASATDGQVRMLTPPTIDVADTIVIDLAGACSTGLGLGWSLAGGPDRATREERADARFSFGASIVPTTGAGLIELPLPVGTPPGNYSLAVSCSDSADTTGEIWDTEVRITGDRLQPSGTTGLGEADNRAIKATLIRNDPPQNRGSAWFVFGADDQRWIRYTFSAGADYGPIINAELVIPSWFPAGTYFAYLDGLNNDTTVREPIIIDVD